MEAEPELLDTHLSDPLAPGQPRRQRWIVAVLVVVLLGATAWVVDERVRERDRAQVLACAEAVGAVEAGSVARVRRMATALTPTLDQTPVLLRGRSYALVSGAASGWRAELSAARVVCRRASRWPERRALAAASSACMHRLDLLSEWMGAVERSGRMAFWVPKLPAACPLAPAEGEWRTGWS